MKQIRTSIPKIINASEPGLTSNILFHSFEKTVLIDQQRYVIKFISSTITEAIVGSGTAEDPEFLESHEQITTHTKVIGDPNYKNPVTQAELDVITAELTFTETTTIGKEIEELLKVAKIMIGSGGFYGLTIADLIIE